MKEFELKYGCNPNQKPSKIYMANGEDLPIEILNGRPGYINFLDAFNSYQLVKELKEALGYVACASFKHVSPTSAAIGLPLDEKLKKACFVDDVKGLDESPVACAYARARGTDRMCSFGDWVAFSDEVDLTTALMVKREVSDGIIAPSYSPEALEVLKAKRNGTYNVVKIDPNYVPAEKETKQVYGITFEQGRNNFKINRELLSNIVTKNKKLPESAVQDLIIAFRECACLQQSHHRCQQNDNPSFQCFPSSTKKRLFSRSRPDNPVDPISSVPREFFPAGGGDNPQAAAAVPSDARSAGTLQTV